MKKIAIIAAMPSELEGYFDNSPYLVVFSGLGKVNATHAVTSLIINEKPDYIVNLGTAGSRSYPQGAVVECSSVVQRDMDVTPMGLPLGMTPFDDISGSIDLEVFLAHLPKGICGTGDSFEISTPKLKCDLVDMEAYAIAKICKRTKVGFSSLKYISDGSDEDALSNWKENLKHAPGKLHKEFLNLVQVLGA